MAVMDKIAGALTGVPEEQRAPNYVHDRLTRGRARIQPLTHRDNECWEFWRGEQHAYVDSKGMLKFLPTKTNPDGTGKRPWKSRSVQNLLIDIVATEVSASTQRVPSYEVVPTSVDPDKRSAAKTAEQVALYGYDKWGMRNATVKAVTCSVVAREAFAWPYFDNTIGPMIMDQNGKGAVGQGDVRCRIYSSSEAFWEPGARFEDSPWHAIEQARPRTEAQHYLSDKDPPLKADADSKVQGRRGAAKASNTDLVMVTEYLELPSPKNPRGAWLTVANDRVLAKRPYPKPEGVCLHKLSYIVDPDSDRDMGLVQHLLDPVRIHNDAWNKLVEWTKLALHPQIFVAPGALGNQKITTEPGAVYQISDPNNNIRWREIPQVPQELFQIAQEAQGMMARISAQNDIPEQVEAGRAIQALIERDQARRQAFVAQLAEWHSHVMADCLGLVQRHYTEPRLLRIKGRWSWETIKDFRGAQLLDQTDVRVAPGSIEQRTRVAMEQKVLAYADRGWITAEQAMAAIEGGYSADIVASYELDIGRATRIIATLKEGEQAIFAQPSRTEVDGETGVPSQTPSYMPRQFDNIPVQKSVWEDWMKTEEYDAQPQEVQTVANDIYSGMLRLEAQQQAQQFQAQQAQAEQAGQQNAARNAGKPMPDAPSGTPGGSELPTPNQPGDQSRPTRL